MADEYFSSWSAGISGFFFMAGILRVVIRFKSKQWYEIDPNDRLRGRWCERDVINEMTGKVFRNPVLLAEFIV